MHNLTAVVKGRGQLVSLYGMCLTELDVVCAQFDSSGEGPRPVGFHCME